MELDEIEVDAFLADSVAAAQGKLYAQGAGWDTIYAGEYPARHPRLGLGVIIRVPWSATNAMHSFTASIQDEDGAPLVLSSPPPGVQAPTVTQVGGQFNLGRPPQLVVGESQIVPLALNLDSLALPRTGTYSVIIMIDDREVKRMALKMKLTPGTPVFTPQQQV
jgi:hypothetical protein